MKGLLEEGQELMDGADGGALRDAMMITAAQKVEHYEIATYGAMRTYATVLGEKGVAQLLDQTLKQEKAADKKLTSIAQGSINRRAAQEWREQKSAADTASGMLQKGADWIGSTVSSAVKRVLPSQVADQPRRATSKRSGKASGRSRKRAR
jgi:Domain of unknown function (DUF892)